MFCSEKRFSLFIDLTSFNYHVKGFPKRLMLCIFDRSCLNFFPELFADNEVLKAGLDNGQVKIFLCDERKVSYESEDSTYGAYKVANFIFIRSQCFIYFLVFEYQSLFG